MPAKVQKSPLLSDGQFNVSKVVELNFFDLSGKKAKTKGTSNKSYHAELQVAKSGGIAQIYSMWGPTGGNQTKDWRHYDSEAAAEKDFAKIIKSKKKKGYVEIEVAQRAYGSSEAKKITKAVTLTGTSKVVKPKTVVSSLEQPTQELLAQLFGSTAQFVATTLKCPLGQLTNSQIDKGRDYLDEAKKIVNKKRKSKKDKEKLEELTNEFYAAIPHNLGTGSRGQLTNLILDDLNKVVQKEDDLDTLLDAKSVGAALNADANVDAQYKELGAELTWVDPQDPVFKFMSDYFMRSKVRGHGFDRARVKNLWSMKRHGDQKEKFLASSEKIASKCGKHTFVKEASDLNRNARDWDVSNRPDLDKNQIKLWRDANTWLCWHGTRSANVIGISKKGLLMRPPAGVVITGKMFGCGSYYSWQSTKSLNYCDGGYWTGRGSKSQSKFMFLVDVAFGNMHKASGPKYYTSPPKGHHSVYGKAHHSGVRNDEMIIYNNEQNLISYLFEITD